MTPHVDEKRGVEEETWRVAHGAKRGFFSNLGESIEEVRGSASDAV